MWTSTISRIAVLTTAALLATSCTNTQNTGPGRRQASSTTATIADGEAAEVRSEAGVEVVVPTGSATGGTLTIADVDLRGETDSPGRESTQGVEVTISNGELIGDATISFELPAGVFEDNLPAIEHRATAGGPWELLPLEETTVAHGRASAATSHFSQFRLSFITDSAAQRTVSNIYKFVFGDGLAGGKHPTCPKDAETLAKFDWEAGKGETLMWCIGTNPDGTVVANVVNNNRYPLEITTRGGKVKKLGNFGRPSISYWAGSRFDEWGSGRVVLAPREGVTFHLLDGTGGPGYIFRSEFTLLPWAFSMLTVALSAFVAVAAGTGAPSVVERVETALSGSLCIEQLAEEVFDADTTDWGRARTLIAMIFDCASDVLQKAWQDAPFTQLLLKAVAMVIGPIIAAVEGLVAQGELAIDVLAGRNGYRFALQPKAAPAPHPDPKPVDVEGRAIEFVTRNLRGQDVSDIRHPEFPEAGSAMLSNVTPDPDMTVWIVDDYEYAVSYLGDAVNGVKGTACYHVGDVTISCIVQYDLPNADTSDGQTLLVSMRPDEKMLVTWVEVLAG